MKRLGVSTAERQHAPSGQAKSGAGTSWLTGRKMAAVFVSAVFTIPIGSTLVHLQNDRQEDETHTQIYRASPVRESIGGDLRFDVADLRTVLCLISHYCNFCAEDSRQSPAFGSGRYRFCDGDRDADSLRRDGVYDRSHWRVALYNWRSKPNVASSRINHATNSTHLASRGRLASHDAFEEWCANRDFVSLGSS
jgi:hypothetical protein